MTWNALQFPVLPVIHSGSYESMGSIFPENEMNGTGSGAYPTANLALFIPFSVSQTITVTKLFSWNGSTASNSIDVGVYTQDGRRLMSGGGALQSGTSNLQIFDITDAAIHPGNYYFAVAMNGTTGTLTRYGFAAQRLRIAGMLQMSTAYPLPATATFEAVANAYLPMIGLLQGRTVL